MFTRVLTALIATLIVAVPAARADDITRSPAQVGEALHAAADAGRLTGTPAGTRELLLERVLQETNAIRSDEPPADAEAGIDALRDRAPLGGDLDAMAGNQRVVALLAAMTTPTAPPGPVGSALLRVAREALLASGQGTVPGATFDPSADTSDSLLLGAFAPDAVVTRSFQLAAGNAPFAAARDREWQHDSGVSITASPAQVLAQAPSLQGDDFAPLRALVRDDGSLQADPSLLQARATADAGSLQAAALGALRDGTAVTPPDDEAAQRAAREQAIHEAATSSTFIGRIVGDQAGTVITSVSGALANLGMAYAKLSVGGLGAFGASGSILSAVSSLGSLFGIPTEEQRVTQLLEAISEQVTELRNRMEQRFDALQHHLDTRLGGVQLQLEALQSTLGTLQTELSDGLRGIERLQVTLDQLREDLYAIASAERYDDLEQDITTYLGTGRSLTPQEFGQARGAFYTAAHTTARDAALQADGSSADDDIAGFLGTHRLEQSVEYLRLFPARTGWTAAPLGGTLAQPVVNPSFWSIASRGFAELALENPGQVQAADLARLGTLRADGEQVLAVQRAVSSGPVLASAIANVKSKENALRDSVAADKAIFDAQPGEDGPVVQPTDGRTRSPLQIDLWGADDQPGDSDTTMTSINGLAQDVYNDLTQSQLRTLALVTRLGGGTLHALPSEVGTTATGAPNGQPSPINSGYWICRADPCGTYRLDFLSGGYYLDVNYGNLAGWVQTVVFDDGAPTTVEWGASFVDNALAGRQRSYYAWIADRLGSSTGVGAAARRLTGAVQLLESYIQLGLPAEVKGDVALQDLLDDHDRLLDGPGMADLFQRMSTATNLPAADPRQGIFDAQNSRADALGTRLESLRTTPADPSTALTRGTIDRLALTATVLRATPAADAPAGDSGGQPPASGGGEVPAPSLVPTPGVPASGAATAPARTAPKLTGLRLAAPRFAGRIGTRLLFKADRRATLSVAVLRRVGRRTIAVKTMRRNVAAGAQRLPFGRGLRRGTYMASVTATASGVSSRAVVLRFAVR